MNLEDLDKALQEERERITPRLGKVSINYRPIGGLPGRRLEFLTEAEKLQCARDYFHTGNLSEIARTRGVFYNDLLELARTGLWQEEVKNLEREANAQLKVKLTSMLGKSLSELEDRLENGETRMSQSGQVRIIPVNARDLATISTVLFDKRRQLEQDSEGFGSQEAKRLLSIADGLRHKGLEAKQIENVQVIDQESSDGPAPQN